MARETHPDIGIVISSNTFCEKWGTHSGNKSRTDFSGSIGFGLSLGNVGEDIGVCELKLEILSEGESASPESELSLICVMR